VKRLEFSRYIEEDLDTIADFIARTTLSVP